MAAPRKVRVPQADGEIVITPGGLPDEARTYQVTNHLASPRTLDEQAALLMVDGARLATPKELSDSEGKPPRSGGSPDQSGTPGDGK